jgi:hypothetical protein
MNTVLVLIDIRVRIIYCCLPIDTRVASSAHFITALNRGQI